MLTEERFHKILQEVEKKGSVTVIELVEQLNISESTIRRDLSTLDKEGMLIKVRGGAITKNKKYTTHDDKIILRQERMIEEKRMIGKYAASLILPDDFVYIDAGTTTDILVDYITEREATYVTNAVSHAKKLSTLGCRVYILGGEFKNTTEAIVGEEAVASVSKYNFTKGFFGTNGVTEKNGYTTPEVKEAMVKANAIRHCKKTFILADESKFGEISAVSFCSYSEATVITNKVSKKNFMGMINIVEVM